MIAVLGYVILGIGIPQTSNIEYSTSDLLAWMSHSSPAWLFQVDIYSFKWQFLG